MWRLTKKDIEQLAKTIPDMSAQERHAFSVKVFDWWSDEQKINPQRDAERSVDHSAGKKARADFWDESSIVDFEVVWKAIVDTTKNYNPESGYAYAQQLRSLLKFRYYRNAETTGMMPARIIRAIRRLRNAIDEYNATASERISEKNVPDWFLESHLETIHKKNRLSLKSFKQILQTTAHSAFPIGFSSDEDGDEDSFYIDPPDKAVSFERIVIFTIYLENLFTYIVMEGGIKKKVVFEKINANVVFSCEAANDSYNIRSFWDFVDHDYAAFFEKNSYDPTDATIIFHHWFYSEEAPIDTTELKETAEWKAKKSNFYLTYKKKYRDLYREFASQQGADV